LLKDAEAQRNVMRLLCQSPAFAEMQTHQIRTINVSFNRPIKDARAEVVPGPLPAGKKAGELSTK